jgi:transposase-like protein
VVSRAVVVAIGIHALGYREVLGIAVGDSEAEGSGAGYWARS